MIISVEIGLPEGVDIDQICTLLQPLYDGQGCGVRMIGPWSLHNMERALSRISNADQQPGHCDYMKKRSMCQEARAALQERSNT